MLPPTICLVTQSHILIIYIYGFYVKDYIHIRVLWEGAHMNYEFSNRFLKYLPVREISLSDTSSGVPVHSISPPEFPAPGPKSIIQSAFLIKSKWCSISKTEFPESTNLCKTFKSWSQS